MTHPKNAHTPILIVNAVFRHGTAFSLRNPFKLKCPYFLVCKPGRRKDNQIMPQKKWGHLTFGERKTIANMVAAGKSAKEIADAIGCSPTTVSREVLRNRTASESDAKPCERNEKFPFVCDGCKKRYDRARCPLARWRYEAKAAQSKADERLRMTRVGLDVDPARFAEIDAAIKEGADAGDSVYQTLAAKKIGDVSVPTVYRWISIGAMTTKRIDLPRAAKFKPRKKRAEYDYGGSSSSPKKDGRHWEDFLKRRLRLPGEFFAEMDYLGTPNNAKFAPLTISFPALQIVFVKKLPKGSLADAAAFLDKVEKAIGAEPFRKVFPCILTDNDLAFLDPAPLEASCLGEGKRTEVYYCDPYQSKQKPHIENKNGQLRRYFPKGGSVDEAPPSYFAESTRQMGAKALKSLGGKSPEEIFASLFGQEIYDAIISCLGDDD